MMKNRDLSSKVLVSLLTMSCVYLGGTSALPTAEAQQYLNDYPDGTYDLNGTYNGDNKADMFRVIGDDVKFNGTDDVVMNVLHDDFITASNMAVINITANGKLNFNMNNHDLTINTPWFGISTDGNATGSINNIKNFNLNVILGPAIYMEKGTSVLDIAANENIIITGNYGNTIIAREGSQLRVKAGQDVLLYNQGVGFVGGKVFVEAAGDIHLKNYWQGCGVSGSNGLTDLSASTGMVTIEISEGTGVCASNDGEVDITAREISIKTGGYNAVDVVEGGSVALKGKTFIDCTNVGSDIVRAVDITHSGSSFTADELHINVSGTGTDVIGAAISNLFYFIDEARDSFFIVNSDTYITVKSESIDDAAKSVGILAEVIGDGNDTGACTSAVFNGKTFIEMNTTVNNSLMAASKGVWARKESSSQPGGPTVTFNDDLTISTAGSNVTRIYGIEAEAGGKVDVNKGLVMNDNSNLWYGLRAVDGSVINVNSSGTGDVQVVGNVFCSWDGVVNMTLNRDTSYLNGFCDAALAYGANLDISEQAAWNMTRSSITDKLRLNTGGIIDMRADGNGFSTLNTRTLSGNDGVIKQDIDVRSMESDKLFVHDSFNGTQALDIYQKDNYVPAGSSTEGTGLVLASVNGSGVFTAKDHEGTLFRTHYDLANQASATTSFATDWYLKGIAVDNETTSVKTIRSANALNYHTWRTENDKLLQRMGELRNNGEAAKGAWFRMQGSKIGRSGSFDFENKYTAYELGYDEVTKNNADVKRYQGVAFSYTDGSSSYSSGSGDNSSKAISFYNTEIGSKGHYLDLVLKISNMDNDFTVYDTNSNKITGDFNNTGVALSAEYGRKNALNNGWYIEPQAQFTLGYLGGDNYTASNGIEVSQRGIKSAVGRIGFNIGKEVGSNGIVYAKANLLHEFGGDYDVAMRDSSGAVTVSDSFNDTWFEYGIGAALQTGKNNHIYFDVERSSGSDFKKDWQWNAGARWTF